MKEQREFRGNPLTLKRLRLQFGWTIADFCQKADAMDKGTAQKLFRGDAVSVRTLKEAASAFNITNHLELLHPDELHALGVDPEVASSPGQVLEWIVEKRLTGWERTANGLQYQVARLRHRLIPERLARGKCYELRHMIVGERKRLEEHLRRHIVVCGRFKAHPNIAQNLDATYVEQGGLWWVLDHWEEGSTLEKLLETGALDPIDLKRVMLGIAEGLHALHKAQIVRRELSPRFILIREKSFVPVLTDFELAKLIDGPTVALPGGLPENPYSAMETNGTAPVDARADVYSWGRIFLQAAVGALPAKGKEREVLDKAEIPPDVRAIVEKSIAKARSNRPADMAAILKIMHGWQT